MSTDLVSPVTAPLQRDAELERFIASIVVFTYTNGTMEIARELLPPERSRLVARMTAITTALKPGARADVLKAVIKMLSSYPQVNGKAGAKQLAEAYMDAVKGIPSWAVVIACNKFVIGHPSAELGDYNWSYAPTAPQLAIVSRAQVYQFVEERAKISCVLAAKKRPSEADRSEPLASMEELRQRYFERYGEWPRWGLTEERRSATDPDDDLDEMCAKYGIDRSAVETANDSATRMARKIGQFVPTRFSHVPETANERADRSLREGRSRAAMDRMTRVSLQSIERERRDNNLPPPVGPLPVSAALARIIREQGAGDGDAE